jgi:signal transduction histidine kinase
MIKPQLIFRRLFQTKVVSPSPVPPPISSIIHDLSNPLTVLNLSLEELKSNHHIRDARDKRHIDTAFRASKKMSLFLSTIKRQLSEKKIRTCFDARIEIQGAIKILRNISKKMNVKIKYRSPRAVFICGDEVKFFRVVSNIISNAIESYISFPIEKNKIVVVKVMNEKKTLVISIRDFGCGIPKHLHKSIFEPFYTTKQRHEGAGGLGLSIVKNIVENDFKGKIKLESTPGKGSIFKIIIPNYLPVLGKRSSNFNFNTANK